MYYKTLGYITHRVLVWYVQKRAPTREQVATVALLSATSLLALGVAGAAVRSRRVVPTV